MYRNRLTKRFFVQLFSTILTNGYIKGFIAGKIYQGSLKHVCVPTLNCYSCPGALFSCPLGAAQVAVSAAGGIDFTAIHTLKERLIALGTSLPLFVIGFLTIIGAIVGRAPCAWVCPFGFFQELMHRLPTRKYKAPEFFRYGKYFFLIVFVVLLPRYWTDATGLGEPSYCKFICPAGTMEGALPLALLNQDLRNQLGRLFLGKFTILFLFCIAMVFFKRPFCSWACPIGAFYASFNKVSLIKLELDNGKCIHCGLCSRACPMGLDVIREIDGGDCIRCLECIKVCPKEAISLKKPFTKEGSEVTKDAL